MTRRFVATLALRMAGLYALFQAIYPTGYLVGQLVSKDERGFLSLEWLTRGGLFLGAAFVLLWFAPSLAVRVAGADEADREVPSPDHFAIQSVGFRLMGVYGILMFVPTLVNDITWLAMEAKDGHVSLNQRTTTISTLVGLAISLFLLFGARGLSGLIERARGAGLEPAERAWTK